MDNNNWVAEFVQCLELGTTNAALASSLDQIAVWMRGTDPLYIKLEQKYSSEWLALRYEEFLDRMFVSENAVVTMFPTTMPADEAKKRYRQLIRVFHPDRGAHEELWLNYRAERVNKAYKEYEHPSEIPASDTAANIKPAPAAAVELNSKARVNTKIKYKSNQLREKLGSARQVQRRIITGLVVASVLLILIVFASSHDYGTPAVVNEDQVAVFEPELLVEDESDVERPPEASSLSLASQKIVNEADWLKNDAQLSDDLSIDNSISSEIIETDDSVNFSNFDTSTKESVGSVDISTTREKNAEAINPVTSVLSARDNVTIKKVSGPEKAAGTKLPPSTANTEDEFDICSNANRRSVPFNGKQKFDSSVVLNVRSGPSVKCRLIRILHSGQAVNKLGRINVSGEVWANIAWPDAQGENSQGWASERFLRKAMPLADTKVQSWDVDPVSSQGYKPRTSSVIPSGQGSLEAPTGGSVSLNQNDIESKLKSVIDRLDSAFERGDAESLAALYLAEGRENRLRGPLRLKQHYSDLFKKIDDRQVTYKVRSYNIIDERRAALTGTVLTVYTRLRSGRQVRSISTFRISMIKVGQDYKIAVFDWKPIK